MQEKATKKETISFVGTPELKLLLEQWAEEEDRNLSQIVRQILKREAQRRKQDKEQKIKH